jgi:DNA polymerase-3 subunit epsilon
MLVAIVSTETTGLTPADEPISIGLLLMEVAPRLGSLVREVDSYYGSREPDVPVEPASTGVHGMTIEMLRGKRFDMDAVNAILDAADVLVAHGADFTARMLATVLPGIPARRWRCSIRQLKWSQYYQVPNHKLDTICDHLGIFRPRPQIALDDCLSLAKVLFLRTGTSERAGTHMANLLAQSDFVPAIPTMVQVVAPAPLIEPNERAEPADPWLPKAVPERNDGPVRALVLVALMVVGVAAVLIWPDLLRW